MEVVADNVARSYGSVRAVDGISLALHPGEIVPVVGANGAGKTTLLQCLAGILALDSGAVTVDGETLTRGRVDLRRRIGFVADAPLAFGTFTILQHIGMVLRLYGLQPAAALGRVETLLEEFGLLSVARRRFSELSRGMAYKATLCAVLSVNPELWLLDEPFGSGMDARGIAALKRCINDAVRRGMTVVYTTQLVDVAETLCTRVCVIDNGELAALGTLAELAPESGGARGALEELLVRGEDSSGRHA